MSSAQYWARRLAALFVDVIGFMFIELTLYQIIGWTDMTAGMTPRQEENWVRLMELVILWLYFAGGEASAWSATPGKRLLGLKTLSGDGQPISFTTATLRFGARVLSLAAFPIALFLAFRDPKRRLFHDRIAGTEVVGAVKR